MWIIIIIIIIIITFPPVLPLRMGTNQYACFTERNPKGRGEEPGNWSFRIQLGSTSSKGLPVLLQGLPPGFFLLIIIIIYSSVAAAAISQLLCRCASADLHALIPASQPQARLSQSSILLPTKHSSVGSRHPLIRPFVSLRGPHSRLSALTACTEEQAL